MPNDRNKKDEPKQEHSEVPAYDVRNCISCGQPIQYRSCKHRCPKCGVMVDCSDAF